MPAKLWIDRYESAVDRARSRIKYDRHKIACGFTNNLDLVVRLDGPLIQRLLDEIPVTLEAPRQTRADSPEHLVQAILQSVALGEGIDLPVANEATQDWLLARVAGEHRLGGSSAQVANTLSVLGMETYVHLTGCAPEQAAAFDQPDRVTAHKDGVFRPLLECANPADSVMWHVVLEYTAGLTFRIDGVQHQAPADSRIIVSYDPVNSEFEIDGQFVHLVTAAIPATRAVFLAGYSQVTDPDALRRVIDETIQAVRTWREVRGDLTVHLELGAMPGAHDLAGVVDALAPEVTSIGMNADEFRDLTAAWGLPPAQSPAELSGMLESSRGRVPTPRMCVHTASFALTSTSGDVEREREALLFGALTASTRARIGRCPRFADLEATLNVAGIHPGGLRALSDLNAQEGILRGETGNIVIVPTIEVPDPKTTVGLGDSFAAGTLVML